MAFPIEIVSDRGTHFINEVIEYLLEEFMVIHNKSIPYHPHENGQAKSANTTLKIVLNQNCESLRVLYVWRRPTSVDID